MGKIIIIDGANYSTNAVAHVTPLAGLVSINVVASPSGGGTVTGSGNYEEGTTVTITATANTNFRFSQWNDGNTNATRTITVGSTPATYTATFVESADITLDLGTPIDGEYYNLDGSTRTYGNVKRYPLLNVQAYAGRLVRIHACIGEKNSSMICGYSTTGGSLTILRPQSSNIKWIGEYDWEMGDVEVRLPSDVNELYLCYPTETTPVDSSTPAYTEMSVVVLYED